MLNEKNYVLSLNRLEVCDLSLACLEIVFAAEEEMRSAECNEYRRENVLPGTVKKWRALHDKVVAQLKILDALNIENE